MLDFTANFQIRLTDFCVTTLNETMGLRPIHSWYTSPVPVKTYDVKLTNNRRVIEIVDVEEIGVQIRSATRNGTKPAHLRFRFVFTHITKTFVD
jgi:hypothetical protein